MREVGQEDGEFLQKLNSSGGFRSLSKQCKAKFGGTVYAKKKYCLPSFGIDAGDVGVNIEPGRWSLKVFFFGFDGRLVGYGVNSVSLLGVVETRLCKVGDEGVEGVKAFSYEELGVFP